MWTGWNCFGLVLLSVIIDIIIIIVIIIIIIIIIVVVVVVVVVVVIIVVIIIIIIIFIKQKVRDGETESKVKRLFMLSDQLVCASVSKQWVMIVVVVVIGMTMMESGG